MYENEHEHRVEFGKWWIWIILLIIGTSIVFGVFNFLSKPAQVLDRVTDPDHIISSYEEFQDIYNTCQQKCTQISVLEELPDTSKSGGFTKQERLVAAKNQLARWVEEYNSKSRQLTRNQWKNPNLPYQLTFKTVCND